MYIIYQVGYIRRTIRVFKNKENLQRYVKQNGGPSRFIYWTFRYAEEGGNMQHIPIKELRKMGVQPLSGK